MEFTDRLMATDRAVSSYIRFAGEPHPSPSETAEDMLADLLHWHERFVISEPPMSKREVRRMVNAAVKKFYEEREAMERGERPLDRARREHTEEERVRVSPRPNRPPIYIPEAAVPLPADESLLIPLDRAAELISWATHPDGCDRCGRVVELFHNEANGLSYCDDCTRATYNNEEVAPALDPSIDRGDDRPF